jgi:hypothetical protein
MSGFNLTWELPCPDTSGRREPGRAPDKKLTIGDRHMAGFLDKERIIAGPGFNRWLVPPAALAIHLCIGMAYGFSVFWLPLSKALGIKEASSAAPKSASCRDVHHQLRLEDLHPGLDVHPVLRVPGLLGRAVGRLAGARRPAQGRRGAALCWCGGMLFSALGIYAPVLDDAAGLGRDRRHRPGPGLHLARVDPDQVVPDRRGMATGMAIMGFGGGAMIGSPLAAELMKTLPPTSVGVWDLLVMALIYFVFMMAGALGYRVPATGWKPAGWTPPATSGQHHDHPRHVHVKKVWGIPQFWLVWMVLCMNVSAGIGVIGMASPMLQEVFGGS